jgi:hypothetical protein
MELRTAEETVGELTRWYESVRRSSVLQQQQEQQDAAVVVVVLPPVVLDEDDEQRIAEISDLSTLSQTLTRLQTSLKGLEPKVSRFRKRLQEKDAVTGNPRFGEKTQARVQKLVLKYDILRQAIPTDDDNSHNDVLLQLQQRHEQQEQEAKQSKEEKEQRRRLGEEQKRLEDERQLKEEQQNALEEQQRQAQEQAAAHEQLRRQAELARQRRLAQEQAAQEWMDSIPKGPEGVRHQIQVLKQATQDDPEAQALALQSLFTIFQQINAHPEETNFRRIRKNHPQYTQDIGRHKGGVEILIAAGFVLGAIDDVPSYLSIEPDLENDMDGWSAWFDLLKATLDILKQEQPKKR